MSVSNNNFVPIAYPGKEGWHNRENSPNAPGFSLMENAIITDRGGLSVRPGTEILGASDTTNGYITSLYTTRMRDGTNVMIRASDDVLQYYNTLSASWALIKSGYTSGQRFGFADHGFGRSSDRKGNSQDQNMYMYFCNGIDPYSRWRNESWDATTATLSGGETAIPVNTVYTPTIYHSDTASSVTTTTITIASAKWAANIWNDFYVRITSGAASGETRKITATTTTQITFGTISGLTGTPTFEIRALKFPETGTVLVGTTSVAYTAISTEDDLTVASAPAAASGSPVTLVPTEFADQPRGNILKVHYEQMYLAGNPQFPTSLYRSKVFDASDFGFTATRVAGEGDVIDIPQAAPKITDVNVYEDKLIVGGESHIEQVIFTQDANDLPNRTTLPVSSLTGPAGRSINARNDLYFANKNNEITSLGRAINNDQIPQQRDIGWDIKYAIRNYDFSSSNLFSYKNYTFVSGKVTSSSNTNDSIIIYDHTRSQWVGEWPLAFENFTEYNGNLYAGSSASREVYQLFMVDTVDKDDTEETGYKMRLRTQWRSFTPGRTHQQKVSILRLEGWIKLNTTVTFQVYYDFASTAYLSFDWNPQTTGGSIFAIPNEQVMGVTYLGTTPLGVPIAEDDVGDFGEFRFKIFVSIPSKSHDYIRLGVETDGVGQYIEITDWDVNASDLGFINNSLKQSNENIS